MMKQKTLLILIYLFSITTFSQNTILEEKLDFLIEKKPTSIEVLDSLFNGYEKNKKYLDEIIKISEQNNYQEGLFFAKHALGKYYRDLSLFDKSLEQYNQALQIIRDLNDIENEIITLNNIGSVYRRQDEIINGLNYNKEALDKAFLVKNRTDNIEKSISVSQNSIGNIYNSLKQYNLALEEFNKAIVVQRKYDDKLGLAINHQNIGAANEALGNLEEALKNYYKSLEYNNEVDSKIGKIICGYSIANVLIKKEKYKEANKTVSAILPLAIKENDKFYLSNTYNTLGLSFVYLKEFSKAKTNLNKALNIAKQYNIQTVVVKANENLAFLNNKTGNYKKAYEYFKIAKEEELKTINARNLIYVRDLITEYNRERAENQIKSLAKKNEIAQLQLDRIINLWILAISIFVLISIIIYSVYRQNKLKSEKKILSLKQDALRSQMNPHFLFNALNSIKLYIINNDQKKATSYLNKFSKLMRKILEASSLQEITLAEEIETMKLYMNIENIRFSNEIDFKVNVEENINLEAVKIPPLVLQPFLENSLWHGLSSKKEDKKITVSIKKPNNRFLEFTIVDNGIGREESSKIKAKKFINRKSVGIDLTTERLKAFVKTLDNNFELHYVDLKDSSNKSLGTKVILKFPLF